MCFELANKSFIYRTELVTYHTEDCISVLSPLKKTFETLYTIEKENVFLNHSQKIFSADIWHVFSGSFLTETLDIPTLFKIDPYWQKQTF